MSVSPGSSPRHAEMDTALPPMSSKQLITASSRRNLRGSESSIVVPNFRGSNNRAAATLGIGAPDSFSGLMGRGGPGSHRRTGSTIRTVMKKIFTRKRGSQHDGFDSDFNFSSANSSHPSQVNGAGDPSYSLPNSLNSKRSGGLAQKEIGNGGPMTLNDALAKLEIRPPRQRRATLPSLIFSDDESRDALDDVISGRPEGNRSRKNSLRPNADPMEDRRRKRRSRSAGQLRGLARDHRMSPIQWRRRSIESYVGSTAYTAVSDSELSIRPPTRATVTSLPKQYTETSVYEEEQTQTNIQVESESIAPNAGTLVNAIHEGENISMEQRLAMLEVKLIDLEFAIARMQTGQSNASSSPAETPVPSKKSESATAANRRHNRKKSTARSPPDTSYSTHTQEPDRPVSTGTIRPGTTNTTNTNSTSGHVHRSRTLQPPSSTSLSDTNSISIEQYSALVMLLRREQTARRNLEGEVSSLRDDIKQLQCMARESVGVGTMYPIRSADSQEFLRMRQAGRSATTSPARTEDKFGCPSPYESDSEWDRPELPAKDELYKPRWQNRRVEVPGMI